MSVLALVCHVTTGHVPLTVLYIGPDVFLPLTSALAAIMGVLLLFWQKVTALVGRLWRMIARR